MREVKLYGHLGKKFGRSIKLDVSSPAEALRALRANFADFEAYMRKYAGQSFRVRVGKEVVGEEELGNVTAADTISFIPVIAGSGAVGKIILGAVLIAAGLFFGQPWLVQIGIGLVVGGVAQALFAPPKRLNSDDQGNKPSYAFNGPINTTAQGNIVPVCYGQLLVGSQVISAGLSVDEMYVAKSSGGWVNRLVRGTPWVENNA